MAWIELVLSREIQSIATTHTSSSAQLCSSAAKEGILEKMLDPEERIRSFVLEKFVLLSSHFAHSNGEEFINAAIERMRDVKENVRNSAILFLCTIINHQLGSLDIGNSKITSGTTKIIDELFSLCSIASPMSLRLPYVTFIEDALFLLLSKTSKGDDIKSLVFLIKYLVSSSSLPCPSNSSLISLSFTRYLRMKVVFSQWIQSLKCMFIKLKSTHATDHSDNLLFPHSTPARSVEKENFVKYSLDLAPDFIRSDKESFLSIIGALFDNHSNINFEGDMFSQLLEDSSAVPVQLNTPIIRKLLKNLIALQNGHSFYCPEGKIAALLQSLDDSQCRWLLKRYPPLGFALIKDSFFSSFDQKYKFYSIEKNQILDDALVSPFIFASFYYFCKFSSFPDVIDDKIYLLVVEVISNLMRIRAFQYPELSSMCVRILLTYTKSMDASPLSKVVQDSLNDALTSSLAHCDILDDPSSMDDNSIQTMKHFVAIEVFSAFLRNQTFPFEDDIVMEHVNRSLNYLRKLITSSLSSSSVQSSQFLANVRKFSFFLDYN